MSNCLEESELENSITATKSSSISQTELKTIKNELNSIRNKIGSLLNKLDGLECSEASKADAVGGKREAIASGVVEIPSSKYLMKFVSQSVLERVVDSF